MKKSPRETLLNFLPEKAVDDVLKMIQEEAVKFRISKSRQSKLGDFRPSQLGLPHAISINGDLNQWEFLIVTLHEFAHLYANKIYGNKIKSHGKEWKSVFSNILKVFLTKEIFPEDISVILQKHLKNPKSRTLSDIELGKCLKKYSNNVEEEEGLMLCDIEQGECFLFNNRLFKKVNKRRIRFECVELETKRRFLFSPNAIVQQY